MLRGDNMTKKPEKTKIDKIKGFFTSKIVWTRIMMTLSLLGMIAFIILSDNSCDFKNMTCDSKSKVNVDVKK